MDRILPTEEELMQMGQDYQNGGKYPSIAKEAEDAYIYENILEIVEKCKESNSLRESGYTYLEDYIGIYRGSWQANYGFYRSLDKIRDEVVIA